MSTNRAGNTNEFGDALYDAYFLYYTAIQEGEDLFKANLPAKKLNATKSKLRYLTDILHEYEANIESYSPEKVDIFFQKLNEIYPDLIEVQAYFKDHRIVSQGLAEVNELFQKFYNQFLSVFEKAKNLVATEESIQDSLVSMQTVYKDWDRDEDTYWESFL